MAAEFDEKLFIYPTPRVFKEDVPRTHCHQQPLVTPLCHRLPRSCWYLYVKDTTYSAELLNAITCALHQSTFIPIDEPRIIGSRWVRKNLIKSELNWSIPFVRSFFLRLELLWKISEPAIRPRLHYPIPHDIHSAHT